MIVFFKRRKTRQLSLCLVLLLCQALCACAEARTPPDYAVTPGTYRDDYILTQLFYAAFSVDNLAPIQQAVGQAMPTRPGEMRSFMALSIELLKTADSRLFMLLAPLAPYVAGRSETVDYTSLIRLTEILSGSVPAGQEQNVAGPDGDIFSFTASDGASSSVWTRDKDGRTLTGRAVSLRLPDSSSRGEAYTGVFGQDESAPAFFTVRDGIVTFAPKPDQQGSRTGQAE